MIGNGDAVGIAGEVAQNMLRAAERRLEVDHPILPEQGAQEDAKRLLLTEGLKGSGRVSWVRLLFRPATNLPRKTRRSTLRGKRKR